MANYDSFLFIGHGTSKKTKAFDPGASAQGVREYDLAKLFVQAARAELSSNPLTKALNIHYDEQNFVDDNLAGNTYKAKSGMTVHINAGGGTGTEVFVPSKETFLAQDFAIVDSISKGLGIPNRGVKSRDYNSERTSMRTNGVAINQTDYYREINVAWGRGVSLSILEVGFIDSGDLQKMQAKIKEVGFEIAKYIAKNCGIDLIKATVTAPAAQATPAPAPAATSTTDKKFRVCVGSFTVKAYAEAELQRVRKTYPTAFIHECDK